MANTLEGERPADYLTRLAASDLGRSYKSLVLNELGVQPGAVVVDLGCGPGADLAALADAAWLDRHRIPATTDRPVERQPGPSRRVCPLIGCVRTRGLVQWPRMGRPCSWLLGGSLSAAELAEERLDAVASRGVAFDLTVPSAAGCIVDELLFHGQAGV